MSTINLSDIIVTTQFRESQPKAEKLDKVRAYVEEHGVLDKPVVLDNRVLTDNYVRYLIAVEKGLSEIPYITTQEYRELSEQSQPITTYIIGKFHNNPKEYVWKNSKNIPVVVGDKVLVKSKLKTQKKNTGIVTVVKVFASNNKHLLRHKPMIKNLSAMKEK